MTVRERMEQEEYDVLSPQAQKAAETKGRPSPEEDNDVRTCYQRDADRILHSKSFRRLMHKTQVFLSPEGDHYRTRMTHTLEVARIARTICRGLRLNQDLAEAAAYGHDLGHTPFGHAGEKALSSMMEKPFRHNEQSLRVVDKLERGGTEHSFGIHVARMAGMPVSIVSRADEILRNLELVYGNNEIVPSRSLKERPGDFESMRDHYAYRREYF